MVVAPVTRCGVNAASMPSGRCQKSTALRGDLPVPVAVKPSSETTCDSRWGLGPGARSGTCRTPSTLNRATGCPRRPVRRRSAEAGKLSPAPGKSRSTRHEHSPRWTSIAHDALDWLVTAAIGPDRLADQPDRSIEAAHRFCGRPGLLAADPGWLGKGRLADSRAVRSPTRHSSECDRSGGAVRLPDRFGGVWQQSRHRGPKAPMGTRSPPTGSSAPRLEATNPLRTCSIARAPSHPSKLRSCPTTSWGLSRFSRSENPDCPLPETGSCSWTSPKIGPSLDRAPSEPTPAENRPEALLRKSLNGSHFG